MVRLPASSCPRVWRTSQMAVRADTWPRAWVDRAGIELRGAGLDESPDCYKRLDEVLDAVEDAVRILHRLTPVGVAMAGANEFDPYKD
jgi:RNA-splicing ligase RtcB